MALIDSPACEVPADALHEPSGRQVFAPWPAAQHAVRRLALDALPAPNALRTTAMLRADAAERVAEWFTGRPVARSGAVRRSYAALEAETRILASVIQRGPREGGLGVRVDLVHTADEPYANAAELCGELRLQASMRLRTIACDDPHPLLGGAEGGVVDQLRVVHDVFGHAALGMGFDLQSEFATWVQCRALFSATSRPAVFCELVGAVTAYVVNGEKPTLRADLPPAELVAACEVDVRRGRTSTAPRSPLRRTR